MIRSVLLLALTFCGTFPAKDLLLQYNLRKGEVFEVKQHTEQKIVQTIMGMDQTGNNTHEGTMVMSVLSVNEKTTRLEARMTHLKSHLKNFMNEVTLDSDGSEEEESTRIMKAMMNKPFYVTLSATGVEKVEGVDKLWDSVEKLDLPDEDKRKVKAAIGQMINDASLKNGLSQAFLTYADKAVAPSETWVSQSEIPADFPVVAENKWFVESATSSQAVIKGEGVFKTTDKTKVVKLPGDLKATVDLAGTQKVNGTATIKTGLPGKVTVDANLSGIIVLLAGGLLPMDVEVPISIDTHTVYTFARK